MVTIACHLDEDGELQYGASIFQKCEGDVWKKSDHIKTAMNRFVLNPVYLPMTKDLPTNVVRDFARKALYKNGVRSNNRCDYYENKMEKKERLENISLVINNHGKSKSKLVNKKRNGFILKKEDYSMEKYNIPVNSNPLKKRSKVKTFVQMFESKFISVNG